MVLCISICNGASCLGDSQLHSRRVMRACLDFNYSLAVGQPQIEEMRPVGKSYASAEVPGACEAFTRKVRIVEGVVIHTNGVAAALTKKAGDLNEVVESWSRMSLPQQAFTLIELLVVITIISILAT